MAASKILQQQRLPSRWSQGGFLVVAVLLNLFLIAQLISVGLAVFQEPGWWNLHVLLVHSFGGLAILLLGWALLEPFGRKILGLSIGLAVLLGLQFLTIHLGPPLNVLHPLNGFLLFSTSSTLVHYAWRAFFKRPASEV
ncbi:DUF6220 domain-containing protein [Gloeobacter kilaueensis]|uniref:Uncharacterized protein n=1 Tax=Gloeobacter kilaueensis (strain ATCC BAA-2537 / CCAP 1431/1 / ULC 316 / JS1) TaxID=1183438 RepID=U5QPY2_GLOK1|nr:DUF6220 domain-containing protein [Gloeobacter kilaueensis]AGY59689.1 hypothetical protein GKIL_3443 [Gloeobacter kilaueensis JS1]